MWRYVSCCNSHISGHYLTAAGFEVRPNCANRLKKECTGVFGGSSPVKASTSTTEHPARASGSISDAGSSLRIRHLIINFIDFHYSNSNYQTLVRDKNASIEILITNYEPQIPQKEKTLFDDFNF